MPSLPPNGVDLIVPEAATPAELVKTQRFASSLTPLTGTGASPPAAGKKDGLVIEKYELRNRMLLGWGVSFSVAIFAGLHLSSDKWFGTDTFPGLSWIYALVFLVCFAFATYTDNVEALKPRSLPAGKAKELDFFRNATAQHYSWIFSLLTAVALPIMVAAGIVEIEGSILSTLVWVGPSLIVRLAVGMSAILHRFVSHRAYEPRNRLVQFVIIALGCLAGQGSPLFWGAMHNRHHKYCDTELDPHSPQIYPFWYAWWGWTITESHNSEEKYLRKLWNVPEIQLLHRFFYIPFMIEYAVVYHFFGFAVALYGCWLPSTLAAAFTLLFNVRSHQPTLDELPTSTCKASNLVDIGAWAVGESAHLDHHRDPKALNRNTDQWFGFYDFPYYLFIKPLVTLRLVSLPNGGKLGSQAGNDTWIMVTTWVFVVFVAFICASITR